MGKYFKKIKKNVTSAVHSAQAKADEIKRKAEQKIRDAERKREDAIHKLQRDAQDKADKINAKIKESLNKVKVSAKDLPYIQLLPFKKIMGDALIQKGVNHDGSLHDICPKFLNIIVLPHNVKAPYTNVLSGTTIVREQTLLNNKAVSPFTKVGSVEDVVGRIRTGLYDGRGFDFNAEDEGSEGGGDQAKQYEEGAKQTMGIIQKILAWFKERKEKKKAKKLAEEESAMTGEPMPENYGDPSTSPLSLAEELLLDKADHVSAQIVGSATASVDNEVGDTGFTIVEITVGLITVCVIAYGVKKIFFK